MHSTEYKTYLNAASELQKVNLLQLSETQRLVFFLNVYQSMYIHHYVKVVYES